MRRLLFATTLMAAAAYVAPAHALVFNLTQDGCIGGCGTGPTVFGTINVEQGTATNSVVVTETLASGVAFVKSSAGKALEFSLFGDPAVNITNLTTGFTFNSASAGGTFGSFNSSITCSGCGTAGGAPLLAGPLTFTMTTKTATVPLSPASFVANAGGYYFSSNISGPTGHHGNVAAVPEPASMALLGAGLIGLSMVRRRTA